MHVERYLLTVCRPMLIAEAVCIFSILLRIEGIVTRGNRLLIGFVLAGRILNLESSASALNALCQRAFLYKEIDVQISTVAKFSISDLECDCHAITLVKLFMKAFSGVCFELDSMSDNCTGP